MANICENTLTVSGDPKRVKEFVEYAKGKGEDRELDFNKFIPYPERFAKKDREVKEYWAQINALSEVEREMFLALHDNHPKDGYNSGGYEWCQKNWETKWNAYDVERRDYKGEVSYIFNTAWSPPNPVIEAMSEKFPDLLFDLTYREEENGFEGDYVCQGGDVLEDESRDIPEEKDEEEADDNADTPPETVETGKPED